MKSMIPRVQIFFAGLVVLAGLAISSVACEKVPLLAPSGSSITLTVPVTALPINGSAEIVGQVIEPAGTPPQRGTLVTFTTTLGTIQPAGAETDSSGIVRVRFLAGPASGTAIITAISGGVATASQTPLRILVGTAAVGSVRVSANPTLLPANGGTSTITAQALDVNGNPLTSAPVSFATNAGTIDQTFATTDQSGLATTILRTATSATVSAAVGAQAGSTTPTAPTTPTTPGTPTTPAPTTPASSGTATGSVTVNVSSAPTLLITPPTTPPGEGLPASFTIAVTPATTNGSSIRSVTVDWGDRSPIQNLGIVTGSAVVSHVFSSAASYPVTATATDSFGNVVSTSTTVTVIPVQRPSIIITQTPNPGRVNTATTLTIQVTVASGIGVQRLVIDFGDGTSADLGGATSAQVPHTYTTTGTFPVTVSVTDTRGSETIGRASINIGI
jgi:hypothetical protein